MSSTGTSPKSQLIEELRDYCEQIENIKEDAQEITAPLNDQQFNWRPAAGKWSISECLAHLNTVNGADLPGLRAEIVRARQNGLTAKGPFRYGFLSRKFAAYMEPPPKIRVPAPKQYRPQPNLSKDQVVPEFLSIHDTLLDLIRDSNGLDLARVKVSTPISNVIKFSLGQCFALITAHDRRHLWQAWQVRKNSNFPV
jgi:hypothetical protein